MSGRLLPAGGAQGLRTRLELVARSCAVFVTASSLTVTRL